MTETQTSIREPLSDEDCLKLEENRKDVVFWEELAVSVQLVLGWTLPDRYGVQSDRVVASGDGCARDGGKRTMALLEPPQSGQPSRKQQRSNLPAKIRNGSSKSKFRRSRRNVSSHSRKLSLLERRGVSDDGQIKTRGYKINGLHSLSLNDPEREKHEVQKPKGRQGRSKEVRERKEREKREREMILGPQQSPLSTCVGGCKNPTFLEDHASGDLICMECASVQSSGGLSFGDNDNSSKTNSKPYMRIVHWRQRLAQMRTIDPEQKQEHVDMIGEFIREKFEGEKNPAFIGKSTFASICRKLNLDPKISTHWIQLRKRLGIEPFLDENCFDPEIGARVNMRYFCVSIAFQNTLQKKGSKLVKVTEELLRNNVMNLNFVIVQLFRLESEELFRKLAKYLPQLISQKQPRINNMRWRVIMEYCKTHYSVVSDPVKGNFFSFEWKYIPLTTSDLLSYFYFFQ